MKRAFENLVFSHKFAIFILSLLGGVCVAWLCNGRPLIGIDDANIFFGYAENIANGRGITYSNNGVPVEGCTSILWLLICALNFAVGFNELGVFLCSLACLVAAQLLWVKTFRKLCREEIVYYILVLTCPAYVTWMSITLMDTALWGMIIAWMAYVLVDEVSGASKSGLVSGALPFVISPLVRPESMYAVSVTLLMIGAHRILLRRKLLPVMAVCLLFVAVLGALTLFRMWYFGFPLPNTYYAKVSPSTFYNIKCGVAYAAQYLGAGLPIVAFAFGSLLVLCDAMSSVRSLGMRAAHCTGAGALWIWTILLMLLPVLTGGDHFFHYRFFQPFYPAVCVLLTVGVTRLRLMDGAVENLKVTSRPLLMTFFACSMIAIGWNGRDSWLFALLKGSPLRYEFTIAKEDCRLGARLNDLFSPLAELPVVGTITAGGISRTYNGRLVDLMGLNDGRIAHHVGDRRGMKNHAAFEPDIFPELGIDIVMTDPVKGSELFLKGMCGTSEFAAGWRYGILSKKGGNLSVSALFARDWLKNTLDTGMYSYEDELVWDGVGWK